MEKSLRVIGFWVLIGISVASCSKRDTSPPNNPENACAILKERPHYIDALQATERKWGVPVAVQMAIIYHESRFDADAKPPRKYLFKIIPRGRISSAYGYSQALDGTWADYKKSQGKFIAQRDDIKDATDFVGWYAHNAYRKLGISKNNAGAQYLAYHEGLRGYAEGRHYQKKWLMQKSKHANGLARRYAVQISSCSVMKPSSSLSSGFGFL